MRGSRKLEPVLWNSVAYSVYKILYTILTTFLPQSKKVAFLRLLYRQPQKRVLNLTSVIS